MRIATLLALALMSAPANATAVPSLSCTFTEPFARVDIWNWGTRVTTPERTMQPRILELRGSAQEPIVSLGIGTSVDRRVATLAITNGAGSDGMSDFKFPLSGTLNGWPLFTPHRGGCVRHPNGTTPRRVTGIVQTGKLNVRARASAGSAVVNRLSARSQVWIFPESINNGWVRGSFEIRPDSESGEIKLEQGWVKMRYLETLEHRAIKVRSGFW